MVFTEAARAWEAPLGVLSTVATSLGVTVVELRDSLFADLPGERLVDGPPQPVSAMELALRTNLAVVQRLLFRATTLRIEMEGHARPVVRHAKWRGLICTIVDRPGRGGALLEISGPFALFRNTRLYGHALGQLLPLLVWCSRFRLEADCFVDGRRRTLQLATGDPIFPAAAPRQYDSRIEESFAREFRRAAPDWDVVREPEPIAVDRTLVFPDFLLQRRSDPGQRWLLEIVGFWTPDYISRKFALYRRALVANLILCIDEARSCADGELPPSAKIIRFRRRVDPAAVLQAVGVVPPPAWNSSKARHADTTRSISG